MYIPVAVPHQMKVATTQIMRSAQMPAMMVEIRAFLSPTIQTWVAVAHEGRREIHQQELHLLHPGAEMFAGQAVGGFVEKGHGTKQEPEFHQVPAGFCGEVVESEAVVPDLPELVGPHPDHDAEHEQSQQGEPGGVHKFEIGLDLVR